MTRDTGCCLRVTLQVLTDLHPAVAVFPAAQDRLDRNFAYPTDRSPSLTPAIQGGLNLGIVFYP